MRNNVGLIFLKDGHLKEFFQHIVKRIILNPSEFYKSHRISKLNLMPREIFGLFLVYLLSRKILKGANIHEHWNISSDPENRDGLIVCTKGNRKNQAFAVEQTIVPKFFDGELEDLIYKAVKKKESLGHDYGKDRHLILYCDKSGNVDFVKVAKMLAGFGNFYSYWILAKLEKAYSYLVLSIKNPYEFEGAYEISFYMDSNYWRSRFLGHLH